MSHCWKSHVAALISNALRLKHVFEMSEFYVQTVCYRGFQSTTGDDKSLRCVFVVRLLSDFINLTQEHNFTVSAQDIFTFRRLSVFTVSLTGILQLLMQIMKRFLPSY